MCALVNQTPKQTKKNGKRKKSEQLKFIKLEETLNAKKPYRFRLLWFNHADINDRNEPFVVKNIHEHYDSNDEGKTTYDYVTCPSTPYINWDSNPYETCPMCKNANKYFESLKNSGYKDKEIQQIFNNHKAKRLVMIPVYVVQDPNDATNNGSFAILVIKEKDINLHKNAETGKWDKTDPYETIKSMTMASENDGVFPYNVTAPDLAVWVHKITISNPKKDIVYNKIEKVQLTKKPYEIDEINSIPSTFTKVFDEDCYTMATNTDLQAFYDKNIGTVVDIPDDDLGDFDDVVVKPKASTTSTKSTNVKNVETVDKPAVEAVDTSVDFDTDDDDEFSELDDINIDELIDETVEAETIADPVVNDTMILT